MTLKYQLDSLEGLDESISDLYIEKNGNFILDVDGHDKNDANKIPLSRLNHEIDKRKAAEEEILRMAEDLKSGIPEDMQDIIPDLPPRQLIGWLRSATSKGLFDQKPQNSIDSKKPGDKPPEDFSNLSPQSLMAKGYKSKF